MKETKRISKLFEDLYDGTPWIDTNIAGTLRGLTAKQASKKVLPEWHSVWEITEHLIKWRMHVAGRLQGKKINVGEDNYFEEIEDTSEKNWKETLHRLDGSQEEWLSFLKKLDEKTLDKVNPRSGMTYYEHIHSIIHHDVYHLGQIALLSKAVKPE